MILTANNPACYKLITDVTLVFSHGKVFHVCSQSQVKFLKLSCLKCYLERI